MSNLLILAVCLAFVAGGLAIPLHASCKVTWSFSMSCDDVKTKINDQVAAWNGPAGCANGGEKCLYEKVSETSNTIKIKHTTPVHHYIDDVSFTFAAQNSGCHVSGYSRSEIWYAVLDSGTNYCNMKNLLTGSGLDQTNGFTETTSNSVCTQYSSSNCDKY